MRFILLTALTALHVAYSALCASYCLLRSLRFILHAALFALHIAYGVHCASYYLHCL